MAEIHDGEDTVEETSAEEPQGGLSSRITQRWNKVSSIQKPEKITRDDILNRWDDSYERRAQLAQKARKPSTIARVITGAALVGAVLFGVSSESGKSSYDQSVAQNNKQISSLQDQLNDAKNATNAVPAKVDGAKLVVDANNQAKDIAKWQNTIINDFKKNNYDGIADASNNLGKHMDGGAEFATSAWYEITTDKAGNPKYWNTSYEWESETPYMFENNGTNMRVVWLCHDTKTHQLLAWAIGDYSSASKKFEGMIWGMTDEGAKRVGTAKDDTKDSNSSSSSGSVNAPGTGSDKGTK